jgi:hypothetical protein
MSLLTSVDVFEIFGRFKVDSTCLYIIGRGRVDIYIYLLEIYALDSSSPYLLSNMNDEFQNQYDLYID